MSNYGRNERLIENSEIGGGENAFLVYLVSKYPLGM